MKKKIIAVCVTCMTVLAMAACGNASQAATSTQTSTSAQIVKSEPQKVTTPAAATKAPETTKAEEKTTVAPTEATTKAPEVTTVAPTEAAAPTNAAIDYSKLELSAIYSYDVNDELALENFVNNVGVQDVSYGEVLDLTPYMDFSNCSQKTVVEIGDLITYEFRDNVTPVSKTTITAIMLDKNYSKSQCAFELDKSSHILKLYTNYIK